VNRSTPKTRDRDRADPGLVAESYGRPLPGLTEDDADGKYGALWDRLPELRQLDDAAARLARGGRIGFDLVASLRAVVGPASGRTGFPGTEAAVVVCLAGLARIAFGARCFAGYTTGEGDQ
jgi:hypothetical protein